MNGMISAGVVKNLREVQTELISATPNPTSNNNMNDRFSFLLFSSVRVANKEKRLSCFVRSKFSQQKNTPYIVHVEIIQNKTTLVQGEKNNFFVSQLTITSLKMVCYHKKVNFGNFIIM